MLTPILWRPPYIGQKELDKIWKRGRQYKTLSFLKFYIAYPLFQILSNPSPHLLPSTPTPTVLSVALFLWLNGWFCHIWCAILPNDNIDLHMSSLGTLVWPAVLEFHELFLNCKWFFKNNWNNEFLRIYSWDVLEFYFSSFTKNSAHLFHGSSFWIWCFYIGPSYYFMMLRLS